MLLLAQPDPSASFTWAIKATIRALAGHSCSRRAPMASILGLLLLFIVATALAGQDLVPTRCLQGPKFWCQDAATAIECQREQYCMSLWAAVPPWDQLEEEDEAQSSAKKCTFCTQMVEMLKSKVGDDPDEDTINKALKSMCRAVNKRLARMCRLLQKKYKDQITEGLQDGSEAGEICTNIRWCKESPEFLN
ncbi:pulmonary surfactant-associated protein B-like [Dermochelys coriacea]|uniref:pulmonary surfactant-associated protein B-like n=1 Tax=Dermochelys coriacea TaxID=27794 RepID=UPI001CA836DC|nr:pulmonary surfactant-associated protein B-like [Dermochelys coriacea]